MKIIIAGAGKIGHSVAALLSEEGHDLTVLDLRPDTIREISNELDVICVEGNATSAEVLRGAGAAQADLLLAAMDRDEVNMVCGISARKLGTRHVIARVRDPEHLRQSEFLREALGLDVLVNPDYECAKEIARVLRFPGASRVDAFSKGSVEIAEHRVAEGSPLDGLALKDIVSRFGAKVLVGVVERGGEGLIPNGSTVLCAGDRLSVTGSPAELRRFFAAIGAYKRPVRRVIIMGGSRIAVYLSQILLESGISVTIVDRDRERCEALCDLVPRAHIVHGDATRSDVLAEEGIETADAFVALTGEDGDNTVTSLYARVCGVGKIITKVNRTHFSNILTNTGLDSIVTPKILVAQQLARYVRAMENSRGCRMETLYRLADGQIEALEFIIESGAALIGVPLRQLRLKPDILISAVIRGNRSLVPDGTTVIQPGDHVVIVAKTGRVASVDDVLEERV